MTYTICELRKLFPGHDFYFFENGLAMQKSPFFHATVKSFSVKHNSVFIEM